MPTIETARLVLRHFTLADWDALNAILADPEVTRYMHFAHWDEQRRRDWLAWIVQNDQNPRRDAYNWAIALRDSGALIGWLGIGETEQPACYAREFGYALNRHSWNQGYMSEAVQAIFAYEFRFLGTQHIIAECEIPNIASARVMQKSGMTFVGTFDDIDFDGNLATRSHYEIRKPA